MPSVSQKKAEGSSTVSPCNAEIDMLQCDRLVPCSNCIARGKQSSCSYDNEWNQPTVSPAERISPQSTNPSPDQIKLQSQTASPLSALGYTKSDALTSFGLYKRL